MRLLLGKMPALTTAMSSPPKRCTAVSSAASTAAPSVMSQRRPRKVSPGNVSAMSGATSRPTTAAPRSNSAWAHALPMPDAAPVTKAISPVKTAGLGWRRSLACSNSQYSISKRSCAGSALYASSAVARAMISMVWR